LVGFGCGIRGLGGLSVWRMPSSATTKAARKAARAVLVAAQEELARRTRADMDDLAVYLSARQRADAVDDWLQERASTLREQVDARRADQLRQCGVALRAVKDRGESIRDIARMAGISDKAVRELIRSTGEAAQSGGGWRAGNGNGATPSNGQAGGASAATAASAGPDGPARQAWS
jgi:hypothetical protein